MHVESSQFPNPVIGQIEMMDLHVGLVAPVGELTRRSVCVFLQPAGALLTEHKVGAELHTWTDVLQVITGLLQTAEEAWGPAQPSDHLSAAEGDT
jgi:hypothetical protein